MRARSWIASLGVGLFADGFRFQRGLGTRTEPMDPVHAGPEEVWSTQRTESMDPFDTDSEEVRSTQRTVSMDTLDTDPEEVWSTQRTESMDTFDMDPEEVWSTQMRDDVGTRAESIDPFDMDPLEVWSTQLRDDADSGDTGAEDSRWLPEPDIEFRAAVADIAAKSVDPLVAAALALDVAAPLRGALLIYYRETCMQPPEALPCEACAALTDDLARFYFDHASEQGVASVSIVAASLREFCGLHGVKQHSHASGGCPAASAVCSEWSVLRFGYFASWHERVECIAEGPEDAQSSWHEPACREIFKRLVRAHLTHCTEEGAELGGFCRRIQSSFADFCVSPPRRRSWACTAFEASSSACFFARECSGMRPRGILSNPWPYPSKCNAAAIFVLQWRSRACAANRPVSSPVTRGCELLRNVAEEFCARDFAKIYEHKCVASAAHSVAEDRFAEAARVRASLPRR